MRRRTSSTVGFTLIEVIASLAIVMFLMAALFQAIMAQNRYQEVAGQILSESQIARALLQQIAEELRGVNKPLVSAEPTRARTLLALGDVSTEPDALGGETPTATAQDAEPPFVEGAERFGLLGTSQRLLFITHAPADHSTTIGVEEELSDPTLNSTGTGEDRRRTPDRWGGGRQVYYLLRPLPEALVAKKEAGTGESFASAEEGSEEEPIEPYYGGVIRQEVRLLFSNDAHGDSFFHLREHLFPPEEEEVMEAPIEEFVPDVPSLAEEEVPLPGRTETRVITDRITALRFRYHDGTAWVPSWPFADRLPVAVEISLSFDPRAADPVYLEEYFADRVELSDTAEGTAAPPTVADTENIEEPLFPYRLVVAMPTANRPIAPPTPTDELNPLPPPPVPPAPEVP